MDKRRAERALYRSLTAGRDPGDARRMLEGEGLAVEYVEPPGRWVEPFLAICREVQGRATDNWAADKRR